MRVDSQRVANLILPSRAEAQRPIIDLARGGGATRLDLLEEKRVVRKDEVLARVAEMKGRRSRA